MDDLQLRQLITEICQLPKHSEKRYQLIDTLITQLYNHPKLIKIYEDNYEDALNITWEWFLKNICNLSNYTYKNMDILFYFINRRVKWRIADLRRNDKHFSLDYDLDIEKFSATGVGVIDYIEEKHRQEIERIALALENYIKQDPDKKLRSLHPKDNPACNCQVIAIRRYFKNPPDKFGDLARELNISVGTMTAHWHRRCKPILQEIAKELGYQSDEEGSGQK